METNSNNSNKKLFMGIGIGLIIGLLVVLTVFFLYGNKKPVLPTKVLSNVVIGDIEYSVIECRRTGSNVHCTIKSTYIGSEQIKTVTYHTSLNNESLSAVDNDGNRYYYKKDMITFDIGNKGEDYAHNQFYLFDRIDQAYRQKLPVNFKISIRNVPDNIESVTLLLPMSDGRNKETILLRDISISR